MDAPADASARAAAIDTAAPMRITAGEPFEVTCTLQDAAGAPLPTPMGVTLIPSFDPPAGVRMVAGRFVIERAGEVAIACTASSLMLADGSPARAQVVAGPAARVTTTLDAATRVVGETVTAQCAAVDAFDNPVRDVAATLRLEPARSDTTVTGLSAVVTRAGLYRAYCDVMGATGEGAPVNYAPGLPSQLTLARSPMTASYELLAPVTILATARDRYGNDVPRATVELASAPTGTPIDERSFSYAAEGPVTVTGTVTSPTEGGRAVTGSTSFVINAGGPTVRCDGPTHGAMVDVAPGATVTFRGTATDTQGVMAVTVNGVPATRDATGGFTAPVTARYGVNAVEIAATDTLGVARRRVCGFLASNRWTPEAAPLDDAISLSLRQDGVDDGAPAAPINSLGDTFRTLLASPAVREQMHTALLASNPIKPLSCDLSSPFGGCLASTRIDYRNITFRSPTTSSFTLVEGGLATSVQFNNVRVDVSISGSVPAVALPTPGVVSVATVQVDVIHDLAMEGGRPRARLRPGTTRTAVRGTTIDVATLGPLAGDVSRILQPQIDAAIAAQLGGTVSTAVGELMGGLFNSLDLSGASFSADVMRPDGRGTTPLRLDVSFSSLRANGSAMSLGLGTRFGVTVVRETPAPFGIPMPPVTAPGPLTAPATAFYEVGLYNQLFFALWRAGTLEARLPVFGSSGEGPRASYIVLTPVLPFVMGVGADGRLSLDVGFFDVELVIPSLFPAPIRGTLTMRGAVPLTLMGQALRFGTFSLDTVNLNVESGTLPPSLVDSMREVLALGIGGTLTNLFRSFPPSPVPAFVVPPAAGSFGLPVGASLGLNAMSLATENGRVLVRGTFGQR